MIPRAKFTVVSTLFIAITTLASGLSLSCGRHPQPLEDAYVEPAGEPEKYSATVVHTIQDGTTIETSTTSEARSGEMRRQEWTEQDQKRALIWRPDLGKSFLLDLDRRAYTEMEIAVSHVGGADAVPGAVIDTLTSLKNSSGSKTGDGTAQMIDRYFDDTQSPARVETRMLAPIVIEGHPCKGYEQRTSFVDGHTEITRRFRADDLAGLVLRIETEGEQGTPRVTTERRDIRLDVAPDAFTVPADFRKIDGRR